MEFLKGHRVTSKLGMGLLLGSTLLSASIVSAANYSQCLPEGSYCSGIMAESGSDKTAQDTCTTSAQVGNAMDANTPGTSTKGNYPCYWDKSSTSCKVAAAEADASATCGAPQ